MGFLDKLFRKDRDINAWVQEAAGVAGSVLLDVRTREEYRQGHIPGSVNVPLSELAAVDETISAKDTPLYVYCLSGGRSAGPRRNCPAWDMLRSSIWAALPAGKATLWKGERKNESGDRRRRRGRRIRRGAAAPAG